MIGSSGSMFVILNSVRANRTTNTATHNLIITKQYSVE
jgi:hypothetical protein